MIPLKYTERDLRIVQQLANGLRPKQIVAHVNRSYRTIEARIDVLKEMFDCVTTAQLVAVFLREKLIS